MDWFFIRRIDFLMDFLLLLCFSPLFSLSLWDFLKEYFAKQLREEEWLDFFFLPGSTEDWTEFACDRPVPVPVPGSEAMSGFSTGVAGINRRAGPELAGWDS